MTQPTILFDDTELLAAIDRTLALLTAPRDLMDAIGAQLEANAQLRFDTKTDPNGQPWAPLSQATKDIYESDWFIALNPEFAGGIPGSLLQRTNLMRASLTHNAGDDFVEVGTSRATKGGRWQIGMLHETGTRKMPRRGILVADATTGALGADDQADVLSLVNDMISGSLFG